MSPRDHDAVEAAPEPARIGERPGAKARGIFILWGKL